MCCMRFAENAGRKKSPFWHHHTTLSGYIFGTKACIDNRKKNLLNSTTSSTCPVNMVNFGLITAEICWRVWGTPANFNRFRVLAVLLHSTQVVGVSKTLRHGNRDHHLYLAGRPSRWALAHILVLHFFHGNIWHLRFVICYTRAWDHPTYHNTFDDALSIVCCVCMHLMNQKALEVTTSAIPHTTPIFWYPPVLACSVMWQT